MIDMLRWKLGIENFTDVTFLNMKRLCKMAMIIALSLSGLIYYSCGSKDIETTKTSALEIADESKELVFPPNSSSLTVSVKTNAEELLISCDQAWCSAEFNASSKKIEIDVDENSSLESRDAKVVIKLAGIQEEIKVNQFGIEPKIVILKDKLVTDFKAKTMTLELFSNVDLAASCEVDWITEAPKMKSATIDPVKYTFDFNVEELKTEDVREGEIIFKQLEGTLTDTIVIKQVIVDAESYSPLDNLSLEKDKKIKVLSGVLSPSNMLQPGRGIELTFDGDMSTSYHSPYGGMPDEPTINLEYNLDPEDAAIMNYMVLYPRTSGANGIIKKASVWIATEEQSDYVKVADIDVVNGINDPVVVSLNQPVINPRKVKISVTDAYTHDVGKYYVSLMEIEFYESKTVNALAADLEYFTDETFSELAPGVTVEDISKIENPFIQNIAAYLLAGKYNSEYRVQQYEAFRPYQDLAKELKTSNYSRYENPTGMFFEADQEVVVFVEGGVANKLSLIVTDFGSTGGSNSYVLKDGLNVITMKGKGNGYINYFTPDWESSADVKVHFASGKVNGYFDITRHTNEDGRTLLDNATSEILDIKGERVHLAYPVDALRRNAYGQLHDMTVMYDSIISSEQTMMGLKKYNRLPKNHMFGRVVWSGYMFADGTGAAFHNNTLDRLTNPSRIVDNIWGIAHEFGHVNQVRPGVKWVGTTEVTNNIYSSWIQYLYAPEKTRLEHEAVDGVVGNRYNYFLKYGILQGQEWGLQSKNYGIKDGKWGGDVFVSLIPLWQLHLYYHLAGEGNAWHKPYLYGDIFEKVRNTDESSLSNGELQMNFVKNVCDVVEQDLSDFFIKIGMLQVIDKFCSDYTPDWKRINQDMIDETIQYCSKYPKPETDYIYYISSNTVDAYKYKRAVEGRFNNGITGGTTKKVSHSEWKNAVVFETYKGNELTHITVHGCGSASTTSTDVPYPTGSTRIEAVAYNGVRTLVFGER
ncbi:hypothetical protein EYV94_24920 [Puteibacter caeruleilacunae]|nr:hypothetical protein EYV94_24920 [Puteibacter caeruleilacunae]